MTVVKMVSDALESVAPGSVPSDHTAPGSEPPASILRPSVPVSRRALLQGAGVVASAAALGLRPRQAEAAKELVAGFIYVGLKDDCGYNQAHAEAAAMLKKMPGIKIVEEEKVPKPTTSPRPWRA